MCSQNNDDRLHAAALLAYVTIYFDGEIAEANVFTIIACLCIHVHYFAQMNDK